MLWLVTSTWIAGGCGRVGFGDQDREPPGMLPDAPLVIDAPAQVDAPVDSPVIMAPPRPKMEVTPPQGVTTVCGGGAGTATLKVANPGDGELVIDGAGVTGDAFQVTTKFPLTVAAGGSVDVQLAVAPAVIGTDVGGKVKTSEITFAANIPTDAVTVSTTVVGANLVVTTPAGGGPLVLSGTSGVCPAQKPVTLRNDGNVTANVTVVVPGGFAMQGATSAAVAPQGAMTRNFRAFTSSACGASAVIDYEVSGPNCGTSGIVASQVNATFNITGSSVCFCS